MFADLFVAKDGKLLMCRYNTQHYSLNKIPIQIYLLNNYHYIKRFYNKI